jgi:DNA polymerase-3 subunit gamma/tau
MSNFIVSARKYRPLLFSDVVGQEHVSQTLKKALQTDHLAHAFLFCGPRGVGKTTCARILAKALNCENPAEDREPCNTCSSCSSFNQNASFNITELDAASNNSVEHIRALIDQVRFQPQQGQYKVFIIDEVHMLSQQAFNAFLKTLEEPPSYAVFILATTEKHKIIPTILSRCQIFDFKRIQIPQTVKHLEAICVKEGITAEAEALHVIAQKADGALRDALSIFDRVTSFSGKELTYATVIENLNVLDYDYFFRATEALLMEDLSALMLLFDEVLNKGFEGEVFINGLAEHFRQLLVCKDRATLQLLESGERLKKRYQTQAAMAPASLLLSVLDLANFCDINYRQARNKRLHIEMCLMKMAFLPSAVEVAIGQGPSPEKKTAELKKAGAAPATPPAAEEPENPTPPQPEARQEIPPKPEKQADPTPQKETQPPPPATAPAPQQPLRKSARFSTPKVDLGSIEDEIHAADSAADAPEKELVLEELQSAWNLFSDKVESESLKTVLQAAQLSVKDGKMVVAVGGKFAENQIRQADGLMDFLKEQLGIPTLLRSFEVEPDLAPPIEKPVVPKRLSASEKLKMMTEQNSLLKEMKERFDLKYEED